MARRDRRRLHLRKCTVAAQAIANYVLANENVEAGVCIAWDTRFGSRSFAGAIAEVLATAGVPVYLASQITPTPALSFSVRQRRAAGGVMVTSSHNPAQWNGVKYKANYGGSGTPSIMTSIESYLLKPLHYAEKETQINEIDLRPEYVWAARRYAHCRRDETVCDYAGSGWIFQSCWLEGGANGDARLESSYFLRTRG